MPIDDELINYGSNIGAGALSGAATGTVIAPGWGALVGAIGGAAFGAGRAYLGSKEERELQAQQDALNAELSNVGQGFDRYLAGDALSHSAARERASQQAREAAARSGLSPAAAIALEQQAVHDVDVAYQQGRASAFVAGHEANMQERNQIMQEYLGAQQLALAVPSQVDRADQMWGAANQAAAEYGKMKQDTGVAAATPAAATPAAATPAAATPAAATPAAVPVNTGLGLGQQAPSLGEGFSQYKPLGSKFFSLQNQLPTVAPMFTPEPATAGQEGGSTLPLQAPTRHSGAFLLGSQPTGAAPVAAQPGAAQALQPAQKTQGGQQSVLDEIDADANEQLQSGAMLDAETIRLLRDENLRQFAINRLLGDYASGAYNA